MKTEMIMSKMAEVEPDSYRFIINSADEVSESPFKKETIDELNEIVKTAAGYWGGLGRSVGTTVAAGVAVGLAGDMVDSVRRGLTKNRNYRMMLDRNPDLRDKPAKAVQSLFGTLHRFNPEFSSDPHVAGSFVRDSLTLAGGHEGQVNLQMIQNIAEKRRPIIEARRLPSVHTDLGDPLAAEKTRADIAKARAQTAESIARMDPRTMEMERDKLRAEVRSLDQRYWGAASR